MSHYYGIGDAAKKLHQKLTNSLAGPLQAYLPQRWITEILNSIEYKFRRTTFSPYGHSLGSRDTSNNYLVFRIFGLVGRFAR